MGVPKFFRYMSERYPCLSEVVREYQIPVFDNLYLDMNGIIHMCSHPDDNNPHFRITEAKLFSDIFHYIEVLFRMIRPQKVFFMAVDGVAPRAKMNQQRGRRFRSAKDAARQEAEAIRKGEDLPTEARFDSNCITPGTEFMAKLQEQLKYFIVKKISTDNLWKKCKVILSGHETPGEGEHKIMDYIRYIRSQPGYDPNTRHCLYGLDADLIMLGLCTHDPHFSLLREEVKFGKKSTKRNNVPEEIRFYLLHLSLMREYLELEFSPLKSKLDEIKQFPFDIEKIIDDWVLMGFLVGNDFIPHLPNLHIVNGALPKLYKAYIDVLPTLDGYINESGTLNLERFEKFMSALASMDLEHFEETKCNLAYMEMKTGRKQTAHTPVSSKPQQTDDGNGDFKDNSSPEDEVDKSIDASVEEIEHGIDPDLADLIQATNDLYMDSDDESTSDDEVAFKNFKDEYYRNKLEYTNVTPEVMRSQAEGYVRAIQWNLNYYYNGVCSWSWYYPHHYAPYISDIKDFSNLKIDFELGEPFKPYEQLLAVLPSASKQLLPECYHHLMTDDNSIIKQYYPEDFQTDLNGKKQEWEAVVLVPFIDEKILLEAMKSCNDKLTIDEIKRNQHGPMLIYQFVDENLGCYKAPNYFSTITNNKAKCTPVYIEDIRVDQDKLIKGAYPGAKFDVFYPGFPTMKHLEYEGELKMARVKIFEQPTRNESMILRIIFKEKTEMPLELLGKNIFVGWPHLLEAKVIALSNNTSRYVFNENSPNKYDIEEKSSKLFESEVEGIRDIHLNTMGIDFGDVTILVHVQVMIGRRYIITANGRLDLEKQFSTFTSTYPLQCIVKDINVHDDFHTTFREITDVFHIGAICFTLSNQHYGSQGKIIDSTESLKNDRLTVSLTVTDEPDLSMIQDMYYKLNNNYYNLYQSAQQVAISNYVFSRITGSLFIKTRNPDGTSKSVNIGLDLKFNKKNQEIPGYSRKSGNTWQYSIKAINVVKEYIEKFPKIFQYLSDNKDVDDLNADEIFGVEDSDDIVNSIQTWLKSLPLHKIKPTVCSNTALSPELVEEIEKIVDEFKNKQTTKQIVMQLKPQLLFKPELQMGNIAPDPHAQTRIFDRIVNIRQDFTVPFGLKGTVIAVHKSTNNNSDTNDEMYDIVFDEAFDDGMVLCCSENRGYRLNKTAFINLSYGRRQMEQKTGKPGALRAQIKTNQFMNNNIRERGPMDNPTVWRQAFRQQPIKILPRQSASFNQTITMNNQRPTTSSGNRYDFMPNYGNNSKNENIQENVKKNFNQKMPKKKVEPPKTKIDIDTDCLKKLLKIDSKTGHENTTPVHSNVNNQSIFESSMCDTAKLMNYFQANCLGCPRYTYLSDKNGFIAQVISPTQQVVTGKPASTREEASENAASILLKILQENQDQNKVLPKFPEPPVKWVMQNTQTGRNSTQQQQQQYQQQYKSTSRNYQFNNQRQYLNRNDVKQRHTNETFSTQGAKRTNTTAKNSFVPLQALMKQHNKYNSQYDNNRNMNSSNTQYKRDERKQETQARDTAANKESTAKQAEKSRPRKTRIAANFVGNRS